MTGEKSRDGMRKRGKGETLRGKGEKIGAKALE